MQQERGASGTLAALERLEQALTRGEAAAGALVARERRLRRQGGEALHRLDELLHGLGDQNG